VRKGILHYAVGREIGEEGGMKYKTGGESVLNKWGEKEVFVGIEGGVATRTLPQ